MNENNTNQELIEEKKLQTVRQQILHEAEKCVCTDRQSAYGSPEDNFKTIAKFWQTYLSAQGKEVRIASKDVAGMMILLKVARIVGTQDKLDNWIDIAGYSACGGELLK
jgi:hypothetical protein